MSPKAHRVKPSNVKSKSRNQKLAAIGIFAAIIIVIAAFIMFSQNTSDANPSVSPSPSSSADVFPSLSPSPSQDVSDYNKVLLVTSLGNITIQLRDDMPITTGNFKNLVQQDVYDGTIFHRVKVNFMIQGGDPTGTGYGDPSISNIPDEFTSVNQNNRGTVAMANAGANTGSSQFFINVVNNNYLDTVHPVFGTVTAGMSVVDAISRVATGANDRPVLDVTIIKAELIP
jgi:peptidylprolyl isomerase